MYYEEKQIDGIWHFRITPKGDWKVMGFVKLNDKLREMEKQRDEARKEAEWARDLIDGWSEASGTKFSWENQSGQERIASPDPNCSK